MSYDSSDWTGRTRLLSRLGTSTMHFLRIPATKWTRPVTLAFLPSTGAAVTLSSGLCFGLRWRRVLTFVKHPTRYSYITIRKQAGRGFFYHGDKVTEAWE